MDEKYPCRGFKKDRSSGSLPLALILVRKATNNNRACLRLRQIVKSRRSTWPTSGSDTVLCGESPARRLGSSNLRLSGLKSSHESEREGALKSQSSRLFRDRRITLGDQAVDRFICRPNFEWPHFHARMFRHQRDCMVQVAGFQ
jgi:hypothetical protein